MIPARLCNLGTESFRGGSSDYFWGAHFFPGGTIRLHESHQMNASDPVNVLLNYGYAVLESVSHKALSTSGLKPTVGFLHEARQTSIGLS